MSIHKAEYLKSGRIFSSKDIDLIKQITIEKFKSGRCAISRALCKELNWFGENGKPKEWVCRELLVQLERDGLIVLPQPQKRSLNRFKKKDFKKIIFKEPNNPFIGKLGDFPKPIFRRVSIPSENNFWEFLVSKYHYLGYKGVVGRFQKYIVYINDIPVSCIGYSGAALKVSARDNWLGWDFELNKTKIKHVANNFRFIIFPWVRIKFLSSHIISKSIPLLIKDWKRQYNINLYLLETFVQKEKFSGISYRAANWIYVGDTKGFSKKKKTYIKNGIIKGIYLYPIDLQKIKQN